MMADKKQITSFIDSMVKASEIIKKENPDYLVAPLLGSVPFIDAMNIVSTDFDASKVYYLPSSSRIQDVNKIIRSWYANFLNDKISFPDSFPKIMGIDEVVSGQSVIRCLKEIDIATNKVKKEIRQNLVEKLHSKKVEVALEAVRDLDMLSDNKYSIEFLDIRNKFENNSYCNDRKLAKKDTAFFVEILKKNLEDKLNYFTIGIEDMKKEGDRNLEYEELKKQKRVIPSEVDVILTMDDPRYCPPRFKEIKFSNKDYNKFSPEIKEFVVTKEYVNFLRTLASYIGKDPQKVSPVNFGRIFDSSKYL